MKQDIDNIDCNKYDAILLCYGLCSNGIVNLSSTTTLVVPKVHDCISILMGSKHKYQEYFDNNIGTFFESPGWIKKDAEGANIKDNDSCNLGLLKNKAEYIYINMARKKVCFFMRC